MKILQDKTYPEMYWVEWPDGTLSADFYNKTRAKEHAATVLEEERLAYHYRHTVKPALEARTFV